MAYRPQNGRCAGFGLAWVLAACGTPATEPDLGSADTGGPGSGARDTGGTGGPTDDGAGPQTTTMTTSSPGSTAGGGQAVCEAGDDWSVEDDGAGDQDDGAEESGFGMGDDMPVSVYQVQQGTVMVGQSVIVSDVLVTSPAAAGEAIGGDEFFVQELDGGPYSGLRVQTFDAGLASLAVPGQTVDVSGRIARNGNYYMLLLDFSGDVVPVGTAEPPEPPVVAAGMLTTSEASARQYEGVIVRVEQATVTDAEPCDGEFTLDDAVRVDDRFMPDSLDTPAAGEIIPQVEGVLVFAQDEYELAPTLPR